MITRDQEAEPQAGLVGNDGIQSVDKALAVLDALTDRAGRYPASLAELTRRTGFHRSSVNRCVISLVRAGYVQLDPQTQRYQLAPKVLRLAQQFVQRSDVLTRVRPYLVRLRDATEETAFYSLLVGDHRVVAAQEESLLGLRRSMEIGSSIPLHCSAASKAILAFSGADVIERILKGPLEKCGPGATTDRHELRMQLEVIRERGYATGQDELAEGAGAVCAPVFNHQSHVVGAIGIAGPVTRLGRSRQSEVAVAVLDAARGLSSELGFISKR